MTHELAWAAGLFDGEGHIGCSQKNGTSTSYQVHLSIGQNDRRVLDRFKSATGFGTVSQDSRGVFRYNATSFEKVQAVVAMLWRWLSPVKRQQATAALARFHAEHRGVYAPYRRWFKKPLGQQ